MTTFEEYFKESGLPFIHDDGYIEHKSGYTIGRADYDEFDEYRPILDVLSTVHRQHPELFDNIDDLNEHECELSCDNRDITISLWNGDLSVSQTTMTSSEKRFLSAIFSISDTICSFA